MTPARQEFRACLRLMAVLLALGVVVACGAALRSWGGVGGNDFPRWGGTLDQL